jgi:membrane-associated phospholipid phosphatase
VKRQLARIVTEVFAPAPTVAALLVVVAWHTAATAADAVRWGLVSVLFASLIPFAYIVRGVRRRRFTDHHVGVREHRPIVLVVGIASVLIGVMVLIVLGAPRDLVALVGSMAVGLISSMLVTLFWKISVHAAVTAGAAVVLVLVFGPPLTWLGLVVAVVAWARVAIGDHTPAQALAGILLGATVAGTAFPLFR